MGLAFRDTRTGRTVDLGSRRAPVTMYVCGPTVYAPSHVGHGRTYLYFDLVRRYFAETGVPVLHLMNITDVEDKINVRARELRTSPVALARREERRFFRDLDALGVLRPTYAPRASDFVGEMVRYARRLERTGRVHRLGDSWFYRPPASTLRRNFAIAQELGRHQVREAPDAPIPPLDLREFVVWRRQLPPRPSWMSPWGPGVPGWHLECYSMAAHHLRVPVDLQGGGQDLIFPHHYAQNEIAFALTHGPFARGFLHTGFVLRNGHKMSKSVGNLVDLGPSIERWGPDALRWYLLGTPRQRPINWDDRQVRRAREEFRRVRDTFSASMEGGAGGTVSARCVVSLACGVERAIGHELGAERAFRQMREFAEAIARTARGRIVSGERQAAGWAYRRIEALTGLDLIGPEQQRRSSGRRAARRAVAG
ncbi:MAG: class I tRNA ligase family protein [Candidatus Thermoplasmatota archaeon]|nr:class I tRNA ligase family protein [Candidatus Thermoplasmatota archaeon]